MSTTLTVVLKFLWYLFSRLLIWAVAIGFVVLAFFMAMDYMNTQTLTKDGLQVRAQVVLKGGDPTTLSKIFSKNFLENDKMLDSNVYQQFKVSDFDYRADIGFTLIFPWQKIVTLHVTEEVSNIVADAYSSENNDINETVPQWKNAIYNITLIRYEDNWRITSMDLLELLPEPTPSPSLSKILE
ncbi:MAG: hypothetical protein ACOX8Q_04925 [Christensenellales bacterium]